MNVALHPQRAGLDVISLCTGGGGLDLGLELAVPGARAVCMVEREAFAVAHLVSAMEQGLLAPCPVWSDARTFDGRPWRGLVDGLIGGIPCQPHSLAGRKRGSLDERDLWSPTRRIIVQARPWFVLIENVAGMLSPGADEIAGAERVWRDLRRLGFAVEGGLFTASEVGAPHERERLFILGVADCYDAGLEGHGRHDECPGECVAGSRGRELVHAPLDGRREGRPEPGIRGWRSAAADASGTVDDASIARGRPVSVQPRRQNEARPDFDRPSLFPPGPNDIDSWRSALAASPELEPAFRRVADGVAARMDLSGPHAARIERLRMLGNGVVPLQAAYAIRTLAARLAARGSAGAARLVRLTEPTHA